MINHNDSDQAIIDPLTKRVELIQAKIQQLMEQQQDIQNQINHYRNLLRQYHAVMEAEQLGLQPPSSIEAGLKEIVNITGGIKSPSTVAEAVRQIMSEHRGQPLKVLQVAELVRERFPGLRGRVRTNTIYGAITYALHRGVDEGLWRKIRSGIYEA